MLLRETHAPTLRAKSDPENVTKVSQSKRFQHGFQKFCEAVTQPIKILLLPSISLVIFNIAVLSGWFNILISSLGSVYQEVYDFPAGTAGFGYIAICLGSIPSLIFAKRLTNSLAAYLTRRMERSATEESEKYTEISHRNYLPKFLAGTMFFAIAYLVYGCACQGHAHWIVSMISLFLYGLSGSAIRVRSALTSQKQWLTAMAVLRDLIRDRGSPWMDRVCDVSSYDTNIHLWCSPPCCNIPNVSCSWPWLGLYTHGIDLNGTWHCSASSFSFCKEIERTVED